jgi:uncharacterized SAM-binding protein YcdF (DUF218 family)
MLLADSGRKGTSGSGRKASGIRRRPRQVLTCHAGHHWGYRMGSIAGLVKTILVPGSISFLALGLVIGVALLYGTQSMQRWARRWLTLLLALYGFLSTPLGAGMLAAPLIRQYSALHSRDEARGADTVVVLSVSSDVYRANGQAVAEMGKATAFNALEAARVYRLLGTPRVIASGGPEAPDEPGPTPSEILRDGLTRLGVPVSQIDMETRSRTTREQALFVADLLSARGVRRFVLVTEPSHMPRAVAAFRALGLDPVPSRPMFEAPTQGGWVWRLLPADHGLEQSDWAAYEHLARLYYWLRGWGR